MITDILSAVTGLKGLADKAIDLIPNENLRRKLEAEAEKVRLETERALVEKQLDIVEAHAKSPSLFIAGYRPAAGWICVFALLVAVLVAVAGWAAQFFGVIVSPPNFDWLWPIMFALLGIGGYRTWEKQQGVSRENLGSHNIITPAIKAQWAAENAVRDRKITEAEDKVRRIEADQARQSQQIARDEPPATEPQSPTKPDDKATHKPTWLDPLMGMHSRGGALWKLTQRGISVGGAWPEHTPGDPVTVRRIFGDYREPILRWSEYYQVPAELIVATIATESAGNHKAFRQESGGRFSAGLMQTLKGTAEEALVGEVEEPITREWLFMPGNSIRAGTAYIAQQFRTTRFDPPMVSAAYNAGSIRDDTPKFGTNRWNLESYGDHIDKFVRWFNDCLRSGDDYGEISFQAYMRH